MCRCAVGLYMIRKCNCVAAWGCDRHVALCQGFYSLRLRVAVEPAGRWSTVHKGRCDLQMQHAPQGVEYDLGCMTPCRVSPILLLSSAHIERMQCVSRYSRGTPLVAIAWCLCPSRRTDDCRVTMVPGPLSMMMCSYRSRGWSVTLLPLD